MSSQRDREVLDRLLQTCVTAARAGAGFIRSRAADVQTIDWVEKSPTDFVTEVDLGAEDRIRDALLRVFPEASVMAEEGSPNASGEHGLAFIVDPLDGTTNFLHGFPHYAVSIAAVHDGDVAVGVVYDVSRDAAFTATRGGGSWLGGAPLKVSGVQHPTRALVGTGFPFKSEAQLDPYLSQFRRVMRQVAGIRRPGAAALDLADVAAGRFDAFWELTLAPWDMAAGLLLVREAGGRVTDLEGHDAEPEHGPLVASNGHLHPWLLEQLTTN